MNINPNSAATVIQKHVKARKAGKKARNLPVYQLGFIVSKNNKKNIISKGYLEKNYIDGVAKKLNIIVDEHYYKNVYNPNSKKNPPRVTYFTHKTKIGKYLKKFAANLQKENFQLSINKFLN